MHKNVKGPEILDLGLGLGGVKIFYFIFVWFYNLVL